MKSIESKLEDILQDLPEKQRNDVILKLCIGYRTNEVEKFILFKNNITNSQGKLFMELMVDELKNTINRLEQLSPHLPSSILERYNELLDLLMEMQIGNGDGNILPELIEKQSNGGRQSSEAADPFDFPNPKHGLKSDIKMLEQCITIKGNCLNIMGKLTETIKSEEFKEIFISLVKNERIQMDKLIFRYNFLKNNGEWPAL